MKRNIIYLSLILINLIGFSASTNAQNTLQNLTKDEVNVVSPYDPTINDAIKINENPVIVDSIKKSPKLKYSIEPVMYSAKFEVEPIKAARLSGEPISKLYRGYVKAGYGLYNTPLIDAFYNNTRSTKHNSGIRINHISSNADINDYDNTSWSKNAVDAYSSIFLKNHIVTGKADFNRTVNHFYGYNYEEENTVEKIKIENALKARNIDSLKQRYATFGFSAKIASIYPDSTNKLAHSAGIKFKRLSDNYDADENYFAVSTSLNKKVDFAKDSSFQKFGGTLDIEYWNLKNKLNSNAKINSRNDLIVSLFPKYQIIKNKFNFTAGLKAFLVNDSAGHGHVTPVIHLNFDLLKDILVLYAGVDGGVRKNSLMSYSNENPFINTNLKIDNTYEKFKIYGGIKGSISSLVAYNLEVNTAKIDRMPFFVNDTTNLLQNKFIVVYDNIDLMNFRAEINTQFTEKIRVLLRADFYNYVMLDEKTPWHKSTAEILFSFNYNIRNKIILKADVFAHNTQYARVFKYNASEGVMQAEKEKLLGYVDFNAGAEWRYTKALSIFALFHNIENVKYNNYRWKNYPTMQFHVIGGLTYSF